MDIKDYKYSSLKFSNEVKSLCSINERFDDEAENIREVRIEYARMMRRLISMRDNAGRSERGRNCSIAITHLEDSLIRIIKAYYSK